MKNFLKIVIVFAFMLPVYSLAQDNDRKSPEDKANYAKDKKAELREQEEEAIKLGKKRHKSIQTKKTRRRMKKSEKRALRQNSGKGPTLWEKIQAMKPPRWVEKLQIKFSQRKKKK